ncbi:hypothetical protein BDW22DRAFT_1352976 [Trametopsis cervina]|nr:hypothetical protein BDW22DRAFT_1352976 [Trametopsis cervina]
MGLDGQKPSQSKQAIASIADRHWLCRDRFAFTDSFIHVPRIASRPSDSLRGDDSQSLASRAECGNLRN